MFVLPGHVGLSENENTLSIAHELSSSLTALQNIPGSFRHLFDITANENSIDFVLVDMSPSLGSINQNILCTSDSFVVPMAPDFFSAMAIRSLSRVLPKWKAWSEKASNNDTLQDADYPWPKISPKYLGSIVQNYRRRSRGDQEARPTHAYQKWFDALSAAKKDHLIPELRKADFLLEEEKYDLAGADLENFLMEVPDFNSLIAISQDCAKPVFCLEKEELKSTGIIYDTQRKSVADFNRIYQDGARKIITLCE
jgi:hypothetical protein